MKHQYLTPSDAASQLDVSQQSILTAVVNDIIPAWILADDLNGVFVPYIGSNGDVIEPKNIDLSRTPPVATFPDGTQVPTKEATATQFWQLDHDCARRVITKGSDQIRWLVPSEQIITTLLTSGDFDWLFAIRDNQGRNLVFAENLYIAAPDLDTLLLNQDCDADSPENQDQHSYDHSLQHYANRLADAYIEEHGRYPTVEKIASIIQKKGLGGGKSTGTIERRIRNEWRKKRVIT